ncbi:MAG: hypothetical protein ACFFGZ_13915 [Candidatus Thorarchaeota archaeon]
MPCRSCGNPKTSWLWSTPLLRFCSFRCMLRGTAPFCLFSGIVILFLAFMARALPLIVIGLIYSSLGGYGLSLRKERPQQSHRPRPIPRQSSNTLSPAAPPLGDDIPSKTIRNLLKPQPCSRCGVPKRTLYDNDLCKVCFLVTYNNPSE